MLLHDMAVSCGSPTARWFRFAVGLPYFILYSLGVPIAVGVFLYAYRESLFRNAAFGRRFYFLYAGFRPKYNYWESVVAVRKVGIAVIAVFMRPRGIDVQAYCALLLVFVSAIVHTRAWPYRARALNLLELGCLCTQFVTFYCGLFLISPSVDREGKEAATSILLLTNSFCLVGIALVLLIHRVRAMLAWLCPSDDGHEGPEHERESKAATDGMDSRPSGGCRG